MTKKNQPAPDDLIIDPDFLDKLEEEIGDSISSQFLPPLPKALHDKVEAMDNAGGEPHPFWPAIDAYVSAIVSTTLKPGLLNGPKKLAEARKAIVEIAKQENIQGFDDKRFDDIETHMRKKIRTRKTQWDVAHSGL